MKTFGEELKNVQTSLHELQRLLLSILKQDHERASGKVLNPAEWFQILLGAPEYAWLKTLNSLVSDVDALSECSKLSTQDLAILRAEVDRLFFTENVDVSSF